MRKRMDEESEKSGLNFTLLATPAEGLSGRFVRIDKKSMALSLELRTASIIPTVSIFRCIIRSMPIERFSWKHLIMR